MNSYQEYLQSDAWQMRQQAALADAGHRCQVCNSPRHLQVHHRTYERFGCEDQGDLTVLCDDCHALFSHRCLTQGYSWLARLGWNIVEAIR